MATAVDDIVRGTNSLRGALFALRSSLPLLGGCHIGYEFMVRDKGHVRSDLIAETTLPASFWKIYVDSGGATLDPVLSRVSAGPGDFRIDLTEQAQRHGKSPFFDALAQLGCVSISTYTLPKDEIIGNLAFSVMEDKRQRRRNLKQAAYIDFIRETHISLRRHGLIQNQLRLTAKECATLSALSRGRNAADVAEAEAIAIRTVEKRLQSVRVKLQSRTTVEAMFKAVAYGVLNGGDLKDG